MGLAVQKWIFGLGGPKMFFRAWQSKNNFCNSKYFVFFDPKLYIEIFCNFVKNLIVLEIFVILGLSFLVRILTIFIV